MLESTFQALSGLTDEQHTIFLSDKHGNNFYMPMLVDIDLAVEKLRSYPSKGT